MQATPGIRGCGRPSTTTTMDGTTVTRRRRPGPCGSWGCRPHRDPRGAAAIPSRGPTQKEPRPRKSTVTSFDNLGDYVAMPRLTGLRLSPDGSWLAATVQALSPDGKKYSSSIWRISTGHAGAGAADTHEAVRLTRSAEGEASPEFLPDGACCFLSRRPGPASSTPRAAGDKEQPALWLLPPGGGEARRIVALSSGVTGLATASNAMRVALARSE